MGIDWKRRIFTFALAAPVAMYLLGTSLGTSALATAILAGCLIEFRCNLCPPFLFHVAGVKPEAKNNVAHAVFIAILGSLVAVAATQSKQLHDAATSVAFFAVFGYHLILTSWSNASKAPSNTTLHQGIVDLFLDLLAVGYIVQCVPLRLACNSGHSFNVAAYSGFSHAILIRNASSFGMGLQVMTLSCSWLSDTGALVAGSLFGSTKLLPTISPGKTVAGAVGSVVFGMLTVVGAMALVEAIGRSDLLPALPLVEQVALGGVMGVLCVLGDLVESYTKRVAQVKDSGALFPGHGGCLDRMDSLLFIAPLVYHVGQFKQWQ
ncbi:hypothetical protein H310_04281 [Aphanomyces invadans]|uniref:Phosphatidate cytidylyltransferase n=1 Tax=Aphanomyces invadans TaxID=157072 RepID=A0A024UHK0_9STRA|nr:hypothetical protein H310_04281 [Aphanomyces invadans]ETW05342.1 hypothetical protein H310_04281 [Aphanomyces invadans]|eukprot:XP_008866781.1 hypothetical protein H310_04281 [Aphanomyces invadans]